MQDEFRQFEQRKQDHITLALMPENQASERHTFDTLRFAHDAIPELDFEDICIKSQRFKHVVAKPFFVSSMTAGHQHAESINRHLIEACSISDWAMGVGSQRRELMDPSASKEWRILRADFPEVVLFSNLGLAQLITSPLAQVEQLCEALDAQALIIHCNPLQEVIQPEGTAQFKGGFDALAALVKCLSIPVIVKETGCGFSTKTLRRLHDIGVAVVDVSGLGGTHWGRIEGHRAHADAIRQQAAETFRNWGMDTISSLREAMAIQPCYEVWGSGGVRHGLDAAKLFALGATQVGFAKPMLEPALKNTDAVLAVMNAIEYELKIAMFCTGSQTLAGLKESLCL